MRRHTPLHQVQSTIRLLVAAAALAVMAWLWFWLWPVPSATLHLSVAGSDSDIVPLAQRYAQALKSRGVNVVLDTTASGRTAQLQRLRGGATPVADMALVLGSTVDSPFERPPGTRLETIAKVGEMPLWLFARRPAPDTLLQLQGLRLAVGAPASSTRNILHELLQQSRVDLAQIQWLDVTAQEAAQQLLQGQVDVVGFVMRPDDPLVQSLLANPNVQFMQIRASAAITELLPYLRRYLLVQGSLPPGNLPAADLYMLTVPVTLVTNADVSPAMQRMVTDVVRSELPPPSPLYQATELPTQRGIQLPASNQAKSVLQGGLPWLEHKLPFTAAQILMRILLLTLPVALLAIWLGHNINVYVHWLVESRLSRLYGELMFIEADLQAAPHNDDNLTQCLTRLNAVERQMIEYQSMANSLPRWQALHQHIGFVRLRVVCQARDNRA